MKVEEAYFNIEKIITYGFLPLGVRYKDHSFILKTISDKEYNFLNFFSRENNLDLALYRLVYSTYIIDGVNFLEKRSYKIPELLNFYNSLSVPLFHTLIKNINNIHDQYLESIKFLEGFCYTSKSRKLWSVFQDNLSNLGFYHGIPGVHNTGLNIVQENWININKNLDTEEDYETQFRLSLMVASAFAGKGAKDMGSRFDFHKKELQELREEIKKYGYDKKRIKEKRKESEWAQPIMTREDLVRELNREMSGHKDRHDLFINDWIKEQSDHAERARQSAENKQKEFRDKMQTVDLEKMESSRLATPEDLKKIKRAQKDIKSGTKTAIDAFKKVETQEKMIKKLSSTIIRNK